MTAPPLGEGPAPSERDFHRTPLDIPVWLVLRGMVRRATCVDLSPGGAQIVVMPDRAHRRQLRYEHPVGRVGDVIFHVDDGEKPVSVHFRVAHVRETPEGQHLGVVFQTFPSDFLKFFWHSDSWLSNQLRRRAAHWARAIA